MNIHYIDRLTKREEEEKVYGGVFLKLLYGNGLFSWLLSFSLLPLLARCPFFSWLYGVFQKSQWSRRKIVPFIKTYRVDPSEFADPVDSFASFNDFFIRKLKSECRPCATGHDVAILPADGRYLVYPQIDRAEGFLVKGQKFCLHTLLLDEALAERYTEGSMVIARLCPTDYHRFHFPCSGVPREPKQIKGPLFSVNPMALKKNIHILSENKRVITAFHTKHFGEILYIEVGATYVGSIHQTFSPHTQYAKGDEKGYFSFGGSTLLLLFEPGTIAFDQDLIEASARKIEIRGLLGQSLGRSLCR